MAEVFEEYTDILSGLISAEVSEILRNPPVSEGDLQELECSLGVQLPAQYRWYAKRFPTGIVYRGFELYGILPIVARPLYSEYSYLRESGEKFEYDDRRLIPIADNGCGGWYCFVGESPNSIRLCDRVCIYQPMDEPVLEQVERSYFAFLLRGVR